MHTISSWFYPLYTATLTHFPPPQTFHWHNHTGNVSLYSPSHHFILHTPFLSIINKALSFCVLFLTVLPHMGRHSCCLKQKLRKGLWSPEEDEKLFNYITRFGVGCWSSVPKQAGFNLNTSPNSRFFLWFLVTETKNIALWIAGLQRCGKSCRLRWINYLRPDLKRGMFSQQEEDLIISLHEVLGNRWDYIQCYAMLTNCDA